jgi:plasmid stabilization system protein ParE
MKRYVFEESAQADVRDSYEWGCRVWGRREAQQWVRQLRTAVSRQLAIVPKGFAPAPEVDEFSEEIRQMVVGRYRHGAGTDEELGGNLFAGFVPSS